MFLPLALASVVSVIFPTKSGSNGGKKGESSPNLPRQSTIQLVSKQTTTFTIGLVLGLGVGAYVVVQVRRRRFIERMRSYYHVWVIQQSPRENDTRVANEEGHLKNIQIIKANSHQEKSRIRQLLEGSGSTSQLLASPETCLTSTMHASLLTITPQTKTMPREAKGAEIYFVVQGKGNFIVSGHEPGHSVSVKDVIIINPWSVRAIQNSAMTENLVLIRVADAGSEYDEEGYDAVSPTNFIDFSGFFFKRLKSVEKFFCKIQTGT